jgi:hypothetical protein
MALIHCRRCGADMDDSERFCPACGTGPSSVPKDVFRRVGWATNMRLTLGVTLGVLLLTFMFVAVIEILNLSLGKGSPDLSFSQKLSLIAVMLLVAAAATFIRQNYRLFYGMTEVGLAMATAWRVIGREFQPAQAVSNLIVLCGLVYLAGRGMVNIVEGTQWRPKRWDQVLASLFASSAKD